MSTSSTASPSEWSVAKDYLKFSHLSLREVERGVGDFIKDDSLKQLAVDAIQGKVTQDCFNSLVAFTKAVAYDGFNPQTIILELVTKAAKATKTGSEVFKFETDGVEYELPKRCNMARDVQKFAALFLVRGNNLFMILKTISKDAKAAISHKIAAYSIKEMSIPASLYLRRYVKIYPICRINDLNLN
ncbi:unnamed protein product [Chrysodeixis includens]|uniref:Uncharacterized protein n=1 Tax=Chrysodeixis includens TaxID=689277 RepID=A0A9N8PY47_CHRIL|nr:unnamed protein product [Chrysodeixis includens]